MNGAGLVTSFANPFDATDENDIVLDAAADYQRITSTEATHEQEHASALIDRAGSAAYTCTHTRSLTESQTSHERLRYVFIRLSLRPL